MEEQVLHLPGGQHSSLLRPLVEQETRKLSWAVPCHLRPLSPALRTAVMRGHLAHGRAAQDTNAGTQLLGWHLTLTYQLCNQDNLTNPSVPQFPPL